MPKVRGARSSRWRLAAATIVGPVLIISGVGFVAAGAAQAAPPTSYGPGDYVAGAPAPNLDSNANVTLCHTGNGKNYTSVSPDVSGVLGHDKTDADDIIPPFNYGPAGGPFTTYAGKNFTDPKDIAIWLNNCNTPTAVEPVNPAVTQAVCSLGVLSAPTITLATTPATVTYTVSPAAGAGGYKAGDTVTVTAKTNTVSVWFVLPAPGSWQWVSPTEETLSITFATPPCGPVKIKPADPTFTQASCNGHNPVAPTLTLPPNGTITYTQSGPAAPSTTVTMTATINNAAAYEFGTAPGDLPAGWTRASATVATFTVTFAAAPNCALPQLTPVDPTVVAPSCSSGVVVPAVVTPAGAPAGIKYTVSAPAPDGTVTVTATVDPAVNTLAPALGWTITGPATATFVVPKAADPTCTEALVLPTVAQASCSAAGIPIAPSLTLPKSVGGLITYSQSAAAAAGTTVTVTATIVDTTKYDFAKPIAPWTAGVPGVATYDVVFVIAPVCVAPGVPGGGGTTLTDVSPVAPNVTQAACVSGVVGAPTITPATTTGLAYAVNPAAPYAAGQTVVVTATITDPAAYALATPAPAGWTNTSATAATHSVVFTTPPCSGVGGVQAVAVSPAFVEASCHAGKVTDGTYTLPGTSGVVYRVSGVLTAPGTYSAVPGSSVVIRMAATGTYRLTSPAAVAHAFAAAPTCHGVKPASTSHTPPLAQTGTKVKADLTLGTLAITLGLGLMAAGRRRRVKPAIR